MTKDTPETVQTAYEKAKQRLAKGGSPGGGLGAGMGGSKSPGLRTGTSGMEAALEEALEHEKSEKGRWPRSPHSPLAGFPPPSHEEGGDRGQRGAAAREMLDFLSENMKGIWPMAGVQQDIISKDLKNETTVSLYLASLNHDEKGFRHALGAGVNFHAPILKNVPESTLCQALLGDELEIVSKVCKKQLQEVNHVLGVTLVGSLVKEHLGNALYLYEQGCKEVHKLYNLQTLILRSSRQEEMVEIYKHGINLAFLKEEDRLGDSFMTLLDPEEGKNGSIYADIAILNDCMNNPKILCCYICKALDVEQTETIISQMERLDNVYISHFLNALMLLSTDDKSIFYRAAKRLKSNHQLLTYLKSKKQQGELMEKYLGQKQHTHDGHAEQPAQDTVNVHDNVHDNIQDGAPDRAHDRTDKTGAASLDSARSASSLGRSGGVQIFDTADTSIADMEMNSRLPQSPQSQEDRKPDHRGGRGDKNDRNDRDEVPATEVEHHEGQSKEQGDQQGGEAGQGGNSSGKAGKKDSSVWGNRNKYKVL